MSVVEEAIMNPEYAWARGGRVEIYDRKSESGYAIEEYRFLIPGELFEGFRETFDFKETDHPVYIKMDWLLEEDKNV